MAEKPSIFYKEQKNENKDYTVHYNQHSFYRMLSFTGKYIF